MECFSQFMVLKMVEFFHHFSSLLSWLCRKGTFLTVYGLKMVEFLHFSSLLSWLCRTLLNTIKIGRLFVWNDWTRQLKRTWASVGFTFNILTCLRGLQRICPTLWTQRQRREIKPKSKLQGMCSCLCMSEGETRNLLGVFDIGNL